LLVEKLGWDFLTFVHSYILWKRLFLKTQFSQKNKQEIKQDEINQQYRINHITSYVTACTPDDDHQNDKSDSLNEIDLTF